MSGNPYWESPEQVESHASRAPDQRLVALLAGEARPGKLGVLDLGSAGGRNSDWLAARGFDVWAVDASRAMVERTRERLARSLGPAQAERRVQVAQMTRLGAFATGSLDLVVALGVYQCAQSAAEWRAALAETARLLRPQGRALVAVFAPGTDLTGEGSHELASEPGCYTGFPGGLAYLVDAAALDRDFAEVGLLPVVPTARVEAAGERGLRVTLNALYRRQGPE